MSKLSFELTTLVDLVRRRSIQQPQQVAYSFLNNGEVKGACLTYEKLDLQARAIASLLQKYTHTGERALLLYSPGIEFISGFFGCLYSGVIAVPASLPRLNKGLSKLQAIAHDALPSVALTSSTTLPKVEELFKKVPDLQKIRCLATDDISINLAQEWQNPLLSPSTLAFLQYTSGSTAKPKGVMVSHSNILHNQKLIQKAFEHTEESSVIGWLPLFHDMGLIGNVLQPLYVGIPCTLMPPVAFLQNPLRWLQAISQYKATTSGGPNFAYDLCIRRITPEQRETLDLSSWKVAFNGAETVRAETIEQFAWTFADCGFRREAFYPCYGMAETTLIVSGGSVATPSVLQKVEKAALEQNQIVLSSFEDVATQTLVGCGQVLQDLEVVIAHPETMTSCKPLEVGEVWVSGPSVANGYWNQNTKTKRTFYAQLKDTGEKPFLRTGDLGFLLSGELFITGRLKDLIVIRGRNHYPQDIELTVEQSHPALQSTCAAAFSIDVAGVEQLVVVVEVKRSYLQNLDVEEVIRAIRQAVAENHELQVYGVLLLKPASIFKTANGKTQRHACRASFLNKSLDTIGSSIQEDPDFVEKEDNLTCETLLALEPKDRVKRLESYLQDRVARVLRVNPFQLDLQQPLITLGLDSLMAQELKNSIETNLDANLSITSLLEGSSIAHITRLVLEQLTQTSSMPLESLTLAHQVEQDLQAPPLQTISGKKNQPLSFIQEQMWFLDRLVPGNPAYNVSVAILLEGQLNITVLHQSINEILRRHEIFQATYDTIDGQLVQCLADSVQPFSLSIVDLGELPKAEQQVKSRQILTEEFQRPFDLTKYPLFRITLLCLGKQKHVLQLCTHHIISDGWSIGVFTQELAVIYSAFVNGSPSPLPELPIQYVDFARWQRQWLQGEVIEKQLSYWKTKLADAPPLLDLPTDYLKPAIQTFNGSDCSVLLPNSLVKLLKSLSQKEEVTLFMTMLTVLLILFFKWTGQSNIVVGTAIANRNKLETEKLIGCLINFLPLQSQVLGNETGLELLKQVKRTALEAYSHQDCPFNKVVEAINPDRKLSQNPLYNVGFLLQNYPHKPFLFDTLEASFVDLDTKFSVLDLKFVAEESPYGISLKCEYNTDLFDSGTIERMLAHFQTIAENFVKDPGQRISDLSPLTKAEQYQLLVEWNDTKHKYPEYQCIHKLFEIQVEKTPNMIALVFEDEQITYKELNHQANQLAHYLQSQGVGPETLVGICLERSFKMVVAILGILKAGGAYVPLEPNYPKERLAFMLEDAQVSLLLTQSSLLELLPEHCINLVCIDTNWDVIAEASVDNLSSGVIADNLAYVIYTSGSTGKPKGVLVSHANVAHLFAATDNCYKFNQHDTWTVFHSIAFDFSVWEIWGALLYGGRAVIVPYVVSRSPEELYKLLCKEQVTVLNQTPSAFRQLIKTKESLGTYLDWKLRLVIFGGEALELRSLKSYFEQHGDQCPQLVNMYGITETTVHVTMHPLKMTDLSNKASIIGRPIPNLQVYLLDQYLQPVPIGVRGEMYIGGAGVTRGYLKRPELTAERFIANPFNSNTEARLYKSGDLARYLPNGDIEYLGRIDNQVKIRGFRIELGEIEAVLSQHSVVREVVVIVREDIPGDKRLVAYLVPKQEPAPLINDLRHFLKEQMPEYMLPGAFVILNALPMTPNGKVDQRSLPVPNYTAKPELEGTFVTPRTPTEQALTLIWAEVLGVKQVGVYDNFFELGGHSLLAAQLISRVRDSFLVDIPLRSLFEATTVAELSQVLIANEVSPGNTDHIARILNKIGTMSDQDVEETIRLKEKEREDI